MSKHPQLSQERGSTDCEVEAATARHAQVEGQTGMPGGVPPGMCFPQSMHARCKSHMQAPFLHIVLIKDVWVSTTLLPAPMQSLGCSAACGGPSE